MDFDAAVWFAKWNPAIEVCLTLVIALATIASWRAAKASAAAASAMTALAHRQDERRSPTFRATIRILDAKGWALFEVQNLGEQPAGVARADITIATAGRIRTRALELHDPPVIIHEELDPRKDGAQCKDLTVGARAVRRFLGVFDPSMPPMARGTTVWLTIEPVGGPPAQSPPIDH